MREALIKGLISHAQGHIDKHVANVEVQLQKATGVAGRCQVVLVFEYYID